MRDTLLKWTLAVTPTRSVSGAKMDCLVTHYCFSDQENKDTIMYNHNFSVFASASNMTLSYNVSSVCDPTSDKYYKAK